MEKNNPKKEDNKGYIKDVIQGIGIIGIIFLILYLLFVLS